MLIIIIKSILGRHGRCDAVISSRPDASGSGDPALPAGCT